MSDAGTNPLSAVQLYNPKSLSEFIVTSTVFCLACNELNLFPSGLYQDRVGVGTPSDTHVNVTVWPIHDLDTEEEKLSIVAVSVDKMATKLVTMQHIIIQCINERVIK